METQNAQPSPAGILQMGTGFWPSKILLTAIEFQLFTHLARKGAMPARDIKELLKLNCTDRYLYDFLDTLHTVGFLQREGILEKARYSNTVDTDAFLDKDKPEYIGGILEMMNNRLYGFWGNLSEGLRTGLVQNEAKGGGKPVFEELYKDPDRLHEFVNAMSSLQYGNFMVLSQKFDFSRYKTFVDAGGSAGMLCILVAKHQPQITCTTVDLPAVEPIAKDTIKKHQMTGRVKTASIDFLNEPLPATDVVAMGNILHDWGEEDKLKLMKRAYDALPDGGAFIAIENIIDDERNKNAFGMMMSLNMLIETGVGFDYTFIDFNRWAKATGFKSTTLLPLTGPTSAAIAYK